MKEITKFQAIKNIKWNELTDISEIGSGRFGSIFKAQLNTNVVFKKLSNLNNIQEDALCEIQILNSTHDCENIICFIGTTQGA